MLELRFLCWLAFKSNYLLTYAVWLYAIVTPKDDKTRLQHKLLVCEDFWPHLHAHQTHFGSPAYPHFSMTQHLSHTFANLTGPSFRLMAKLLPNKKKLGIKYTWVNSVKKWPSFYKINCFKNVSCQKMSKHKKYAPKLVFFNEKNRKIWIIFYVKNWL